VIVTPFLIKFMFTDICPVGILTGTFPILAIDPSKYIPNPFFWIAMVIFVLFIILIFVIERGWCRYFCPVGAILAPFNKISMLHISVNTKECIHCNICSDVCPMGIDVADMDRDPECILCGKCISVCPNNGISYDRGLGK
jgi:polyferredoxin